MVLIRIYIRGVDTKPDGSLAIELGLMYSRLVSVIRSERITAAVFRVPPYTSGLHMPSSEVFFSLLFGRTNANTMWKLLFSLFLFCIVLTEECAAENSWGANLFHTQRHDFGRVALGADTEFRFELTNIYDRDVKLIGLRSSCSCIAARVETPLIRSGETGAVIVRLNTSGQHLRDKSAVLTVQLETLVNGFPRFDTVQLFVSGHIRPDVLLTPGSIEFGAVCEGTAAERTLQLEYTGRPGWALIKVERSQPFIFARAEEIRRERGDVVYRITVGLRENAPPGYIRDVLRFTTNELQPGKAEPVEIILPVQGVVTASMQVKPSPMLIGILAPGETATKNIVLWNETPFRITAVAVPDNRFRFAFSEQESTMQLITLSFSATPILLGQPHDITEVIRISTNDPRQSTITVNAFARIVDETASRQ